MELQEGADGAPQTGEQPLALRSANVQDTELLVQLNMSGFHMTEADTREYVNQTITVTKNEPDR